MLISMAYAQEAAATATTTAAPSPFSSIGLILIMVVMFYFLLIRPQQKRFKEHKAMLDALQKGDRVVTAGGLVGTIEALPAEGGDEVIVDLGNGLKVTALRHTIQAKADK